MPLKEDSLMFFKSCEPLTFFILSQRPGKPLQYLEKWKLFLKKFNQKELISLTLLFYELGQGHGQLLIENK
jgi:hypothetical protein